MCTAADISTAPLLDMAQVVDGVPADESAQNAAPNSMNDTNSGIEVDLGCLVAYDRRVGVEGSLIERARDGVEPLVHALFRLPSEYTDDGRLVTLPKATTRLPREKHIPKERAPTKWEEYAKAKGIQKKRRDRLVLDEATGEYVPRYGKGSKNALDREVILPHNPKLEPGDDPFAAKRREKKERVKKERKKQLANIGRREKNRSPKVQPLSALDVTEKGPSGKRRIPLNSLKDGIAVLQKSTASAGKFDERVKNEPKQITKGKRRKFQPVADKKGISKEHERASKILERVLLAKKN